ncbi:MAG: 50S ribosomal protein L32e [Thermoplasmata archaeon]
MSPEEKISERIRELPHMNEEHLKVLEKHGIATPEKLLEVIRDKEKWDSIHPELKGIGPKTVKQWEELLEIEPEKKAEAEKEAPAEKKKKPKKTEKKTKEEPSEEGKEEKEGAVPEEEVEIVEEGAYVPKKKPKISPELKDALLKRARIDGSRPEFYRQEYGRYKKLETGWRKPRGIHSKTRMKMRYRRPMVSVGYRGPKTARGLHPSGFEEIRVCNVNDLSKVEDADRQAVRIAHTVGQRKRNQIIEKADELGIRVLNRGG